MLQEDVKGSYVLQEGLLKNQNVSKHHVKYVNLPMLLSTIVLNGFYR